eukprot:COSAG02_NODE_33525_length_498_cov_1.676692_1_plen_66_part_00
MMMSATDGGDDDETRQHGHDEHGHKDDDVDYELDCRTSTGMGTYMYVNTLYFKSLTLGIYMYSAT